MQATRNYFLAWINIRSWRWRRQVPPKRRLTFNGLHRVISLKTELFFSLTSACNWVGRNLRQQRLFIYGLFNGALCSSDYIKSNGRKITEWWMGKMCKERVLALFQVLFRYLPRGTEENHNNLNQDSLCSGQCSNRAPPEYQSEALVPKPTRWVLAM
jgi:hypothetical protein